MRQKKETARKKADIKSVVKRTLAIIALFAILYLIYTFAANWDYIVESFNKGWESYN